VVTGLSVLFALVASDGGLIANLAQPSVKASVYITFISFGLYLVARLVAATGIVRPRRRAVVAAGALS
jgi:zinc/manganese transport system permease protein